MNGIYSRGVFIVVAMTVARGTQRAVEVLKGFYVWRTILGMLQMVWHFKSSVYEEGTRCSSVSWWNWGSKSLGSLSKGPEPPSGWIRSCTLTQSADSKWKSSALQTQIIKNLKKLKNKSDAAVQGWVFQQPSRILGMKPKFWSMTHKVLVTGTSRSLTLAQKTCHSVPKTTSYQSATPRTESIFPTIPQHPFFLLHRWMPCYFCMLASASPSLT